MKGVNNVNNEGKAPRLCPVQQEVRQCVFLLALLPSHRGVEMLMEREGKLFPFCTYSSYCYWL